MGKPQAMDFCGSRHVSAVNSVTLAAQLQHSNRDHARIFRYSSTTALYSWSSLMWPGFWLSKFWMAQDGSNSSKCDMFRQFWRWTIPCLEYQMTWPVGQEDSSDLLNTTKWLCANCQGLCFTLSCFHFTTCPQHLAVRSYQEKERLGCDALGIPASRSKYCWFRRPKFSYGKMEIIWKSFNICNLLKIHHAPWITLTWWLWSLFSSGFNRLTMVKPWWKRFVRTSCCWGSMSKFLVDGSARHKQTLAQMYQAENLGVG